MLGLGAFDLFSLAGLVLLFFSLLLFSFAHLVDIGLILPQIYSPVNQESDQESGLALHIKKGYAHGLFKRMQ